ncbi:MAG: hypothetical protein ACRBFS_09120 [Aureispira sp.]
MRKSKIAKLFDWASYQKAQDALTQSPDQKTTIKQAAEQDKLLRNFQTSVTKDLKLGLKMLQEALKKGELAEMLYFLHLDYFAQAKEGTGSLLIFGTQPAVRKEFVAAGKTREKVNLSYGTVKLDTNNILRFVPEKNGMKVKPKPLVDTLKQAPIAKSNRGFWSKRKINNVIIGAKEEASDLLTGDSDLVEEDVTYTERGVNSEVYDAFKSFVNRDYVNSNGTRNAEYYAQTLKQVDVWVAKLQAEFKAKGDRKLQKAYKKMGKVMMAFKKKVQKEMEEGQAQYINEESSLSSMEQVFMRTLEEHESSDDAYQQSVLKGKLERILMELGQKINGDENATEALALQTKLEEALADLSGGNVETNEGMDPEVQRELTQLVQEIQQLLQQHANAPIA